MESLISRLQAITSQAGGTWGIGLKDLETGKTWGLNEQHPFYAASIIKVPIMITLFAASHRGEVKLSDTRPLRREDIVGGEWRFTTYDPGNCLYAV